MKHSSHAQSATSLPRAPRVAADARSTRYLLMMGLRVVCFLLMVLITPYGWYTWVLGAAAIFLPYIAVVSANVGEEARGNRREDPQPALPTTAAPPVVTPDRAVIRIQESRREPAERPAARDPDRPE